jgi:surfeit locus 1 family protein
MTRWARARTLIWPAALTLAGLSVLVSLGVWQLQRRAWKEGLIATIAARTAAAPVALAEAEKRLRVGADVEYVRVRVRGRFLHEKEQYFYAQDPRLGPGFHIYTPLEIAGEQTVVFVNRGFVTDALKAPEKRLAGQVEGEVEMSGLVRGPDTKGLFTAQNDAENNLWYWRDLDGLMASAFGDRPPPHIPVFVEAEAAAPGGWPKGSATRLELPNRHLQYAITWFGLAAALAGVFLAFAASHLKS